LSTNNWIKFIFLGLVCGPTFMWIKLALREVDVVNRQKFVVVFGQVFYFDGMRHDSFSFLSTL
jgi:hypothetical protein